MDCAEDDRDSAVAAHHHKENRDVINSGPARVPLQPSKQDDFTPHKAIRVRMSDSDAEIDALGVLDVPEAPDAGPDGVETPDVATLTTAIELALSTNDQIVDSPGGALPLATDHTSNANPRETNVDPSEDPRVHQLEALNASVMDRLIRLKAEKAASDRLAAERAANLEEENVRLKNKAAVAQRAAEVDREKAVAAEVARRDQRKETERLEKENEHVTEQLKATRLRMGKRVRELEAQLEDRDARLAQMAKHGRNAPPMLAPSVGASPNVSSSRGDESNPASNDEIMVRVRDLESRIGGVSPAPKARVLSKSEDTQDTSEAIDSSRRRHLRNVFIDEIHCPRYRNVRAAWIDWFGPKSSEVSPAQFRRKIESLGIPGIQVDDVDILRREITQWGHIASEDDFDPPKEAISFAQFVKFYSVTRS